MKKLVLLCVVTLCFTSCATIFDGGSPTIHLEGNSPEPLTIVTEKQTYPNVMLPATVQVNRHKLEGQRIKITSENYEYPDIVLEKKINGITFVNILIGGVIGWAVDAATNCVSVPQQKYYNVSGTPKKVQQ